MVDLRTAIQMLIRREDDVSEGGPPTHLEVLADDTVQADFEDPDHVYLVTVTQVPRVHLQVPDVVLADIDGALVHLAGIQLAHYLTVVLEGRGPEAERQLRDHREQYRQWSEHARGRNAGPAPDWPAEQLSRQLRVSDDLGTEYHVLSGSSGGEGKEWLAVHNVLPRPPSGATVIHLHYVQDGQEKTASVQLRTRSE